MSAETLTQSVVSSGFMPQTEQSISSIALQLASRFADSNTHLNEIMAQLRQFKAISDMCPVPMFMTDHEGNLVYVNRPFSKLTGTTLREVQADGWKKFMSPTKLDEVVNDWQSAVNFETKYENTIDWVKSDGSTIQLSVHATKIPDDGWVGFCNLL